MGTDKKINVCHLISGDLWAGAEVQMFTLVAALNKAPELNVSAIVLNEGKLVSELRNAGIEVAVIDESQYGFLQILRRAKKILGGKNIDILHTHRYKENILGALLRKNAVVSHLLQTVHGTGEPFKGIKLLKALLYSLLDRRYSRKYHDKIHTVSLDIKNEIGAWISPDKIAAIHNAVDPANIVVSKTASEIRYKLGIKGNEFIIGSAGRMVPIKGYDIFLDMAKIISADLPHARFLLVGDGPIKMKLENKAREMNLENKVIFSGFRDDIIDIINCFDIFVISSHNEGIPMVLLEAMAMKKPIVATAVGGINEIIENDVSGLLVAPGDARSLADSCIKIFNDLDQREKLGIEAKNRIEVEFTVDIQKNRMLKLYQEIMNRR
ncbi:MAG: glycosyltransferase [Candidatus Zixiibacteriota bacterium]|nr:MAG: glycosyltransferase [candidate division Zixibacteria bacterium]